MQSTPLSPPALPRALRAFAVLAAALAAASPAFAQVVTIAPAPLASTTSGTVKPNVSFVLDSSGSMAWSHAPDEAEPFTSKYGYKSSQCNSIYYNPNIKYVPPKNADGTDFPNSSFTAAWVDGFNTGSGTVDLSSRFQAYDNNSSAGNGSDSQQAAYYYTYSGSEVATGLNYQSTNSTFYKQCNSSIGSNPGRQVFTKVTVSSTSGPGGTDERTNFANWYSYYRIRILMMKSGAGRAFAGIGPTYRVGFMTIYATPSSSTTDPQYLSISDFDTTQKASWYSKFYAMNPSGSTPLKRALSTAGRNFAGKLGPDPIQYSCQQNFLILTTDGYWNAGSPNPVKIDGASNVGNQDNTVAATPRPMYDGGLAGASNTLADGAAYYYNTDLRDSSQGNCTGAAGVDVCTNNVPVSGLDNAATQHMTTFTLGLGTNGQLVYTSDYLTGGSSDYNAIVSGSKNWPSPTGDTLTTIDDLWHAAVNGHGQYFSAKNPDLLVSGLRSALSGVSAREAAGAAAATSNLEPVAGDNSAFVANYRTVKWDGDVQSRTIDLVTGAIANVANWSAQAQLDGLVGAAADTRTIYTVVGGTLAPFLPASFSAAQKTSWFTPTAAPVLTQSAGWNAAQQAAATPDTVINYLRGQTGFEERAGNAVQLYRVREHVLGDIINGKPVYVKKPPFNYTENNYQSFKNSSAVQNRQGVVYVAANDGMLHAINSDTGVEMWAYVPSFVLPNLKALADDNYANAHQYYVDGSPTVGDIWTGSAWKTILVGGLNAGGKGYYALDVTNPASPRFLWEFTNANMGLTFGNPVIGKLENGTWVVAVTSGYNNADGVGHLYLINAATGALSFTIDTSAGAAGTPSNLGKISGWADDALNDNTIKRVYGGDMQGNLWRFDVNGDITGGRNATQLASFQLANGYKQPVTTVPELGLINNKPMVFVGTGRYLSALDVADKNNQSLYGIVDQLRATGLGDARTESTCPLVKQSIVVLNANQRSTTTLAVDLASKCGWYLDFDVGGSPLGDGERINVDPKLQLGVLAVATNIPQNDICTVGGSSFLYFFDYATGQFVSTSTGQVAGTRLGNAIVVGLNTYRLPDGRVITSPTLSDDTRPAVGNPDNPLVGALGKRVLWRELLN